MTGQPEAKEAKEAKPKSRLRIRIRKEPQPTPEQIEIIESVEDSGIVRTPAMIEDPVTGDWVDGFEEDRSGCDATGLSIGAWAALLLELLPGQVNGYYHGLPATQPTQSRPGSPEREAVFRSRISRGEELFHPDDNRRK